MIEIDHLSHILVHDFEGVAELAEVEDAKVGTGVLAQGQGQAVRVPMIRHITQVNRAHPVQVAT